MNDTTKPELAEDSSVVTVKRFAEDYALWLKSEPFSTEYAERLASLLPPLWPHRVGKSIILAELGRTLSGRHHEAATATFGVDTVTRGKQYDLLIVDDVACEGGDYAEIERRVLAWMDFEVLQGLNPGVFISLGEPKPFSYYGEGAGVTNMAQAGPCTTGAEVQHTDDKPLRKCVPFHKQESSRYSSPNMRRSRRRGQPISHESRGVRTNGEPARDLEGAREIGAVDKTCRCGKPAYRSVAGPGQGGLRWHCEASYITFPYGARSCYDKQPERPEEPI